MRRRSPARPTPTRPSGRGGSTASASTTTAGSRAVEELAENAARHAGEAPTVEVRARAVDGDVEFAVDDGPGVPAAERAVVLGERGITATDHGSGLGLWLARTVAETLDGTFGVEVTNADDGGTVATLRVLAV